MQAEAAAGKPALPGLPAFRDGDGVETLTLTLRDVFGLEVQLRYTVYEAEDLITRTAVYTNTSSLPLTLHKAASLCLDFAPGPMDLITLNGTWAAERTPERAPLRWGIQSIGSTRGIPGHAHNPAAILCTPDCTETAGSCWGFALVYSGNFLIEAERADAGQRLVMGIHPYHFHWQLEPGASFAAPEAAVFAVGDVLGGAHGPAGANSLPRLPLQGLDAAALYEDEDGARYTGCQLMTLGLPLPGPGGHTPACIWYLRRAATCQDDKKG